MKSEWETLRRVRQGHESSWRELLNNYQSRLKALAYLITGSVSTAEDVAQETLLRAATAELQNEAGSLSGFLGTIAYRLALKEVKRSIRNIDLTGFDFPDSADLQLESILKTEQHKILAETIRDLGTEHREVLVLKFYGELTFDEIAGVLQIPIGTAKSRLFHAVKNCRDKLREKGII